MVILNICEFLIKNYYNHRNYYVTERHELRPNKPTKYYIEETHSYLPNFTLTNEEGISVQYDILIKKSSYNRCIDSIG